MCGIVIAGDVETFVRLCTLNESRGNYSFGGLYLNRDGYMLQRRAGTVFGAPVGFDTYLGHNRAPTSDVKYFDPNNSHPFVYGDWIVAHNGIIRNFQDLQELYRTNFEVDSNIIPFLLSEEVDIREVFKKMIGTFGCWVYNIRSASIYVYRSTNSLFYSKALNAVSSIEFKDSIMMKDNTFFHYKQDGIRELWTLDSAESPFYIPD